MGAVTASTLDGAVLEALDALGIGVAVGDRRRLLWVNPTLCQFAGRSEAQLLEHEGWPALLRAANDDTFEARLAATAEPGKLAEEEPMRLTRPNGATLPFLLSAQLLPDERIVLLFQETPHDTRGLVHDLRNPLNAITLSAAVLAQDPECMRQHERTVRRITSSAERIAQLLQELRSHVF